MKKQEFKVLIDAPREKVWDVIIGKETYPQWTAPFSEGSNVETDWKKGSKAIFGDGKGSGMVSEIADNKPNEFLSIRHLGMIKDGVEDLDSEDVKKWSGAMENYTLKNVNGKTEWTVEMDMGEEWADYMNETWPLALQKAKELAEQS
ncbi:SRPBCC family protein [Pedobacter steynii]|uniref:ATPase n=1 Tax=Pedobacter steynii TaxID=430522 RepID=A0A1D7QIG5_9SPHI|nr:SRPBCC domain-containing protein [Pedobacter steynii]AOM78464.1 ATPase [Pedobacter steynii]